MIRPLLLLLLFWWGGSPVAAHGLRVFATTDGAEVSGYGFFIGGGRVRAAPWSARMGATLIAEGRTDDEGRFVFALPEAGSRASAAEVTILIDTGDGHVAKANLKLHGDGVPPPPQYSVPTPPELEAALARQIAPLQAQIAALEARLRLTDLISGLCLIAGLAGMALWVRRR